MKILHLNFNDVGGGAGIAAYRVHTELQKQNQDSIFWVYKKQSNDPSIQTAPHLHKILGYKFDFRVILHSLYQKTIKPKSSDGGLKTPELHIPSNLPNLINQEKPDIVHIHWTQNGFLTLQDLKKINVPIIFTSHDMWLFTDGPHYVEENSSYFKKQSLKKKQQQKKEIFEHKKISFIHPSHWMQNLSKKSPITNKCLNKLIPNGIPTDIFLPHNKEKIRKKFNLPQNKSIIFFGAVSSTTDKRKGFDVIKKIIEITQEKNYHFIVLGNRDNALLKKINAQNISLFGHISNPNTLSELYSASDITIIPSKLETFCLVAAESQACGTPVVSFDTSGLQDVVAHKETGYRAKCYDTHDMITGINWCLNHFKHDKHKNTIRERVLQNFDIKKTAQQHLDLYQEILDNHQ